MKTNLLALLLVSSIALIESCSPQMITAAENEAKTILTDGTTISQSDAAAAIREALTNGINNGVMQVSAVNGYLANASIKVMLPQEAKPVENVLRDLGEGLLVDHAVTQMNHAAEQAAPKATAIFVNAITNLSISDALGLVQSKQPDACTQFLRNTTTDALVAAFKPSIKDALDQTHTTQAWSTVMGVYNKVPFASPVNADLPDYVTHRAIDGLFYMIAQEEAKIRKDPMGQASDLIKKVFGSVLNK